jgi:hypothetical protein
VKLPLSTRPLTSSLSPKIQKPPIASNAYQFWPKLNDGKISNNANYASYVVSKAEEKTLFIKNLDNNGLIEIGGADRCVLSADEAYAIFSKDDQIGIVHLSDGKITYIRAVKRYQFMSIMNRNLLFYLNSRSSNELTLLDLNTGRSIVIKQVLDFFLSENSNYGVLHLENPGIQESESLEIIDLENNKRHVIWQGSSSSRPIFNNSGDAFAFIGSSTQDCDSCRGVYYYSKNSTKASRIFSDQQLKPEGEVVKNLSSFSANDSHLIFDVKKPERQSPSFIEAAKVDIYNFLDNPVQSMQLKDLTGPFQKSSISKTFSLDLHTGHLVLLSDQNQNLISAQENYVLVRQIDGQSYSSTDEESVVKMVDIKNGEITKLPALHNRWWTVSPKGSFILYYDDVTENYFSYSTTEKKTFNITATLGKHRKGKRKDLVPERYEVKMPDGWLANDSCALINRYGDLWQLDLAGRDKPICLTNEIGRKQQILFKVSIGRHGCFDPHQEIILSAFNLKNKLNGFYSILLQKESCLSKLTMEAAFYDAPDNALLVSHDVPLKAKNVNVYLVKKESSTSSPNYFTTSDFKYFRELTNLRPEKEVNGVTKELIRWRVSAGLHSNGILYKPENFQPEKKYPLIVYYYRQRSDLLNTYEQPIPTDGSLSITYFVSNGYIVFSPDIVCKYDEPGESALRSVVSGTNYLLSISPFINASRIGLYGHSFGGYETNYIISHSNMFAAACSAAGIGNLTSYYGGMAGNGGYRKDNEYHVFKMRNPPWKAKMKYVENSPIFYADKVRTPLLMMHNKSDRSVEFAQGFEFYSALSNLKRPVWLLQYDQGGHTVHGRDAEDYQFRLTQFFDHYLKDAPAPIWMTRGIKAIDKGKTTGYELDTEIKTPGPGLVTPEEQQKIDDYSKIPLEEKLRKMVEKQ